VGSLRTVLLATLFAVALPGAIFFMGAYSYSWGAHGIQQILWAPVEATQHGLESLCTAPESGSFVCPYGQGAHNRLFLASFFLVYVLTGAAIAWAFVAHRRRRRAAPQ